MFYKALGFAVWKGAKWYVRRRLPPRKLIVGGAVALGIATLVAAGAKRDALH
ncbi:MAG: hypothetical protein QOI62_3443 [Solirubrobacteraceae bacterium]|jgi:hypothetical protein|nr:hypothetical protein [Solirubrobacteraceae bacterium]MEA2277138.1 hypothetical protein [Solirubrobacteraceae bacterium]MEA2360183.1 hypothetical protein [Solirubrobacteraceae bacterium]